MKFDRRISILLSRFIFGPAAGVSCFSFNCVSAMEQNNQQAIEEIKYNKAIEILKWSIAHCVNNYILRHPTSDPYDQQIRSLYDKITSEDFKLQICNYKLCIIEYIDKNYRDIQTFKTRLATEADIALAKNIWTNSSNEEVISLVNQSKKYLESIYH